MSSSTIGFAHWQLYWAVVALATSELSRRDRLVEAVASRVNRIFPLLDHPGDLPPDIWQRTAALHERLTAGGSYRATVDAMADAEVELTIRSSLNCEVCWPASRRTEARRPSRTKLKNQWSMDTIQAVLLAVS